jgi:trk system potassium uptake protein TrkA
VCIVKIVIMGCGRTGAALATDLSADGHDVTVLDTDAAAFRFLPDDFSGAKYVGSGLDIDTLRKVKLDDADAFISTTRGDNRNVMAAQMAKHVFRVKVVGCRVFDPMREEMYRNLGLRTINPTRVQAKRLKRMIEAPTDEAAGELVREFMRQEAG